MTQAAHKPRTAESPARGFVRRLGGRGIDLATFLGGWGYLLVDTVAAAKEGLFGERARRTAWPSLAAQMVRVGVRSLPIVSLVMVCIGAILALQIAPELKVYGVQERVADIISIAMFRELGPLVSAIVLTGFAGASIAAEMGTMVVSEEVEAMESMAIPPIRFLVLPRVLATTVMMVCVAVVGDLMGVTGGLLAAWGVGISPSRYITNTFAASGITDFVTGLVKAGVFGAIIASLACYLGLRVTGGALGVGAATTRTVVLTIVALIIVDLLFTAAFYAVGV